MTNKSKKLHIRRHLKVPKSTVFTRIEFLAETTGLNGVAELSEKMGYSSPEKLYRLGRGASAKPSFDIIVDFAKRFKTLNLRWFLLGEGEPFHAALFTHSPQEADYIFGKSMKEIEVIKEFLVRSQAVLSNYDFGDEELSNKDSYPKVESNDEKKKSK